MTSLDYRSVENALAGCRWGHTLFTYESIGSTMDRARELAHKKAPEGTLVIAAKQTEGRGRLKRAWISPAGSLSLSLLLYPSPEKLPYLTMLAGLAAIEAIELIAPLKADLKWPNDVQVNGKKIAGILVESGFARNRAFAVIGVGINVNTNMSLCTDIADIATSLSDESGGAVDTLNVLRCLIEEIESLYSAFDPCAVHARWRGRLITLGQQVKATSGNTVIDGLAVDVTVDGALIIRQSDGTESTVVAGDVTLR